jgi:hypothetical protein
VEVMPTVLWDLGFESAVGRKESDGAFASHRAPNVSPIRRRKLDPSRSQKGMARGVRDTTAQAFEL